MIDMTSDKILVISSGSGFMADALVNNLKEVGFTTEFSEPVIKKIDRRLIQKYRMVPETLRID